MGVAELSCFCCRGVDFLSLSKWKGAPMADSPFWMIVPGNAALSALILFVIAMPFLYAARKPVHELVRSVGHLATGPLRLVPRWLLAVARQLRGRTRPLLPRHAPGGT